MNAVVVDAARSASIALFLVASSPAGACTHLDTPHSPPQHDREQLFAALRTADMELATLSYRLATANAALCDRLEPATGLKLHTLDQFGEPFRTSARSYFGFASPVTVEGIVPDSPADRAGLRLDDAVVRIGPIDTSLLQGSPGTTARLVAVEATIASFPVRTEIMIDVTRRGAPLRFKIMPVPACRSRFELRIANNFEASADGSMVQVSSRFLEMFPVDQVAAVVAHELAHNILHHRERLDARGVRYGILSGLGANVRYFRQTEMEADIVSATLLRNAGFDSRSAIAFWRSFGPRYSAHLVGSRSHPAWRDRVAALEREVGAQATHPEMALGQKILAGRSRPLDGDWQSILDRH